MSETVPKPGKKRRSAPRSIEEKIKRADQRLKRARRKLDAAREKLAQARGDLSESQSKSDAAERNFSSVRLEFLLSRAFRRMSLPQSVARRTVTVLNRPGPRFLISPLRALLERFADPATRKIGASSSRRGGGLLEEAGGPAEAADRSGLAAEGTEAQALPSEPPVVSEVWSVTLEEPERVVWTKAAELAREPEERCLRFGGALLGLKPASTAQPDETRISESLSLFSFLCRRGGEAGFDGGALSRDMRLAVQHMQLLPEGLNAIGGNLRDISLVTDRHLRLRFEDVRTGFVLRAYQYGFDPQALRLVDEAAVHPGGFQFVDIKLLRPLMPALFVVSDAAGVVVAVSVLPFPSLCRDGLHFPELLDGLSGEGYVEALATFSRRRLSEWATGEADGSFTVGSIAVDPRAALGTEPIFSRDVQEWLLAVFHVALEPFIGDDGPRTRGERFLIDELTKQRDANAPLARDGRGRLCLNAAAAPTLAALSHSGDLDHPAVPRAALSFLVNGVAGGPAWSRVRVPHSAEALTQLQNSAAPIPFPILEAFQVPADFLPADGPESADFAWAVARRDLRFVQEANLIFPVAPDSRRPPLSAPPPAGRAKRILVVLPVWERLSDRFHGIRRQDWEGEIVPVVLVRHNSRRQNAGVLLERNLGRMELNVRIYGSDERWSVKQAVGQLDGDGVLFLSEGVILHDRRMLTTVTTIAAQDGIATAGCALIQESPIGKKRQVIMHSVGCLLDAGGPESETLLKETDYSASLQPGTFPVAMNSPALFFSSRQAWDDLDVDGELDDDGVLADAGLAEAAARRRLTHLCTSLVTAGWSQPTMPRSFPFPSDEARRVVLADSISISPVR